MSLQDIHCFAKGDWLPPGDDARTIPDASSGWDFARVGGAAIDPGGMVGYARELGGPGLRGMGLHDRARMVSGLAAALARHRDTLAELSFSTGATPADHRRDIDAGIAAMRILAARVRRQLPDGVIWQDGPPERLSRNGQVRARHVWAPMRGVAVHINAFNQPIWGLLTKLAPCLLAGMPAIVKPASANSYMAEKAVWIMMESGLLPDGAVQLVSGDPGDLLDHIGPQDVVSFTGTKAVSDKLGTGSGMARIVAEHGGVNAHILGSDIAPGTPDFDLFLGDCMDAMTASAGQMACTTRRVLVPAALLEMVGAALVPMFRSLVIGNPRDPDVQMGALTSADHRADVMDSTDLMAREAKRLTGTPADFEIRGADWARGAFLPPTLYRCDDPDGAIAVHHVEAFGPIMTLMPYRDIDHAADLTRQSGGDRVTTLATRDADIAAHLCSALAGHQGRIVLRSAIGATAPIQSAGLPQLVCGGPGGAGDGMALAGVQSLKRYMQQTAIIGGPDDM